MTIPGQEDINNNAEIDIEDNIDTEEDYFADFNFVSEEETDLNDEGLKDEKNIEDNQESIEEFDEIDYNKEKIKIPVSERKTYLQKGYNYDKINQQKIEYENQIREIEKVTGMKYEDIIKQQQEQSLYQEAEKLQEEHGIDEDLALRIARQEKRLQEIEARDKISQFNAQNQTEISAWQAKEPKLFESIQEEVYKTMQESNVNFDVAYRYVKGNMSYDDISNILNKNIQQSAVADIHDKIKRGQSIVNSADGTKNNDKEPKSDFVRRFNKFAGI